MTIEDILEEYDITFHREGGHHHARPGWLQLDCPFCGPKTNKFHLGYNVHLKYFNCWKCGGHHPVPTFQQLGILRETAQEIFRGLDTETAIPPERTRISLQEPAGIGPLLRPHRDYLRERGFKPKQISSIWGVQGIGLVARLSWRLYIPIIFGGAKVSWTSRAIGDRVSQRYLSASAEQESMNHKELVYGIDYCRHSIVIVEGPIDAWKIGPGAGALFGTAFTPAQVRHLINIPYRFICFDSSREAQLKAQELANQLAVFPGETQNIILDAKDPGEASEKELRAVRRVAKL